MVADLVDHSIIAYPILVDTELISNTRKQQVVAAAQVCFEGSASTTVSLMVAKVAPWSKVAPLYGNRHATIIGDCYRKYNAVHDT